MCAPGPAPKTPPPTGRGREAAPALRRRGALRDARGRPNRGGRRADEDASNPKTKGRRAPAPRPPGAARRRGAYWTFAVSELAAFRVKVQVGVLAPPLLHTPDQITDRPLVALRVMLVPTAKLAEPVVPTGTFSPAGVERTLSPARPVAVSVSSAVTGAGAPTPQTFATPPPPQVCGAVQTPHVSVPPQPSGIVPQFFPSAAQVVGVHGAGALASTPDQRVSCVTPPTAQRTRIAAVLPAATVPLVTKLTAVARTSGTARAANGVTVAVPEMPPTVIVAPVQPAGKRAGSMLMRLSRVLVPSVRASPAAGKPGRLGFSPPARASVARRTAPMHPPPEQLSPLVVALPSLHASALLRCPQPTAGGVQKSVVHTLASSQVFGAPTHAPRVQVSATVQTLASVQGATVKFTKAQVPAPSQALLTHTSGGPQGWPRGSAVQSGEQQSPATRLPSSHCSPRSSTPLPQMWAILPMMVLNRLFCCPPTGNPGPTTRTKF